MRRLVSGMEIPGLLKKKGKNDNMITRFVKSQVSEFWRGELEARTIPLGVWIGGYRLEKQLLLSFKSWLVFLVEFRSVVYAVT